MAPDRFDDLTRTLATGISRRRALELSGGVLTGGLAAVLGRRRAAQAQPGGECTAFCNALFPAGPARGTCKSQAARGEGICVACGADVERACVAADGTTSCPDRDCAVGFEFDEDTCACMCATVSCVDAAGAEICCAPKQDCGVVGAFDPSVPFQGRRGC